MSPAAGEHLYFNECPELDDGERHHKLERIHASTSDELSVLASLAVFLQGNRELIVQERPMVAAHEQAAAVTRAALALVAAYNSAVAQLIGEPGIAFDRAHGGAN